MGHIKIKWFITVIILILLGFFLYRTTGINLIGIVFLCLIFIFPILFIIFGIKSIVEKILEIITNLSKYPQRDDLLYEKLKERGYFRISLLNQGKKYTGIISFKNEKEIHVFIDYSRDYHITYGNIKEWGILNNSYLGPDGYIGIQYFINEKIYILRIKPKRQVDSTRIIESLTINNNRFIRKQEIEKQIRARYRAGNVEDVSPDDFEKLVAELFTYMGYAVFRIGGIGDGGVDITGKNETSGQRIIIQCKKFKGKVGVGIIRDVYGTLRHKAANQAFVVTTGNFTKDAYSWAEDKPIELIDKDKLSELLKIYYR